MPLPTPNNVPSLQELEGLRQLYPLLGTIAPDELKKIVDELSWKVLSPGHTLFKESDSVDAFYFVASGLLEATTIQQDQDGNLENNELTLEKIRPGSTIGEMQILTGGTCSATVRALEESKLLRFPKETFDKFLDGNQTFVDELAKIIMPRLYRDEMVDVLPQLFGELTNDMLADLQEKMSWRSLHRGEKLCSQGDKSDSFYIIISGRMQATREGKPGERPIVTEMTQGESTGEVSVITGETDEPRLATIIASRDSELVEFSREEFEEFTQRYPTLMRRMVRSLISRLKRPNQRSRRKRLGSNILLAPASEGALHSDFANKLHDALISEGGEKACLLLTSEKVDDELKLEGISQADQRGPKDMRLRCWLSEQEKKYAAILLQADATVTNWTRRCNRNADEVMYVADAALPPATTAIVDEVRRQEGEHQAERRHALVLIHRDDVKRPQGTLLWLKKLGLDRDLLAEGGRNRHFHIRRQKTSDYERLARYVSGREVGLVLSGGGARGFAHVGCISAMRKLKIPIDMIAGVSMGSVVSAAYAYDPDRFEDTIDKIASQLGGILLDFTPPVVSIARGKRFDKRLRGWFRAETKNEDVQIEDLWMPYFCVSSNLTNAKIVVHETGPLWWSVRASGTLPGLSSPVVHGKNLLFDGCLLDNLPMDVMRERLGNATVIAVDVVPPEDLKFEFPDVQSPSGWSLLCRKLNPFLRTSPLPNIATILHRAGELGSVYGRQKLIDQKIADIYLDPEVEEIEIGKLEKESVEKAKEIGYKDCLAKLHTEWPAHQAEQIARQPT